MFKLLFRLKPYFLRYRFHLVGGLASLMVTDLTAVSIPWLMKGAIDSLGPIAGRFASPAKYVLLILIAAVVQGLFRYVWRRGFFGFSRRIEWDLRNDLLWHIQRLPLSYIQRMRTGDLMSRLTSDLTSLREFLGLGLLIAVDAIVVITASLCSMVLIDPWLTLWSIVSLPPISVMVSLFTRQIFRRNLEVQQGLGSMSTFLQENLTGIRVLKAYAQEQNQTRHFSELSEEYQKKNLSLVQLWGLFWPLIEMFAGVGALVVLWLGGRRVVEGTLSLGELVAFFGYLALLTWPLIAIGYVVNLSQRGLSALTRLLEILEEKEAPGLVEACGFVRLAGMIQFQSVSFRYSRDGPWVLKNVSFEITPGTVLGLVGEIGCGKSTIASLILRFHEVEEGTILIDGEDIRRIPVARLRDSIAFVSQDIFLFSNTLSENIRFGRKDASDQQVLAACRSAGLNLEDRELVHGLDTILGERGVMLSGGQRQRVALARAFLRDSPIVILDDPFSSMDSETERSILDRMEKLRGRKTTLMISHRLSSVQVADEILYLKDGAVVERGSHGELIRSRGYYRRLFQKQLLIREMELLGFSSEGGEGR